MHPSNTGFFVKSVSDWSISMGHHSRFETTAKPHMSDSHPRRATRARQDSLQLQKMIGDMRRFVAGLDAEIALEEDRVRVHDQSHYTYPITAKTMRTRRDNLMMTITALDGQLQAANRILGEQETSQATEHAA
jgi:hypothetical protein